MVAEFRIRKEIKQREAARAVILCHLHYFSIVSVCACFAEPHQHVSFSAILIAYDTAAIPHRRINLI
jgi:hypothetical protein